jgi:phosphogluconate 2-dehydrogenase
MHLVEQQALYQALAEGRLAGAGLDTIADEGLDNPLLELPNVVGTPHLGNRCVDSVHEVMDAAIDDALAVLRGERPAYLVNPEVYTQPTLKTTK